MSTYIQKNGQKLGPFNDDQILSALWVGIYSSADLAWREGMTDWQPLGSLYTPSQLQPPGSAVAPYRPEDSASMRFLLPVGCSAWSIAAGYLGLFSVLLVPAPFAVLVSVIALRDIGRSRSSDRPRYGKGRAIFGLIMGGLCSAVMAYLLIAGLLTLPR